jgi:alpha-tubulin suppressor-like RCC1 family protein
MSCGANDVSQLGIGDTLNRSVPTLVNNDQDWEMISTGHNSHALKQMGDYGHGS